MRVLNLLKTEGGVPQIIRTFPVVDNQLSAEVIEEAEKTLCYYIFGPECDEETMSGEFFYAIDHAYRNGVSKLTGPTYHLLWSHIEDV